MHERLLSTDQFNFIKLSNIWPQSNFLYSAGHAELNIQKSLVSERIIWKRDRIRTLLIADSGGYQIIRGLLKKYWYPDGSVNDDIRYLILKWMEAIADLAMTLDHPPFSLIPKNKKAFLKNQGFPAPYETFWDCLAYTINNLEFFDDHQSHTVPFINVVHGDTVPHACAWYDEVKSFDAIGWAFAGALGDDLSLLLPTIEYMARDDAFNSTQYIHFLGKGSAKWIMILAELEKHFPAVTVTYDNANPFVSTGHRQIYHKVRPAKVRPYLPTIETKKFNFNKPYSQTLNMLTYNDLIKSKTTKVNLDGLSYAIISAHNLEIFLELVRQVEMNVVEIPEVLKVRQHLTGIMN